VAVYLISKGVDPARVVAIGQGEALPWATNQTEAGRAANRRVIFHIEGVSDDQEKKELEIQRQRARKETGAPLEPDTAAKPPETMGPPVPPGLVTDDAKPKAATKTVTKTVTKTATPSPPAAPKPATTAAPAVPKATTAPASAAPTKTTAAAKRAAPAKGAASPDAGAK
jgi:hypothetical protein